MKNLENQLRSLSKKKLNFKADYLIRFRLYREIFLMDAQGLFSFFWLKKGLSFVVLMVLVLSSTSAYAYGSPAVSYGHGLYPLKQCFENIEIGIACALSDGQAIDTYVKMAQRRVDEYVKINERVDLETNIKDVDKENSQANKTIDEIITLNRLIIDKTASLEDGKKEDGVLDRITDIQLNKIATVENRALNENFKNGLDSLKNEIKANRANFIKGSGSGYEDGGEVRGVYEKKENNENGKPAPASVPSTSSTSPHLPVVPKVKKPISFKHDEGLGAAVRSGREGKSSNNKQKKSTIKRHEDLDKSEGFGVVGDGRTIKPPTVENRTENQDREEMLEIRNRDKVGEQSGSSTREAVKVMDGNENESDMHEETNLNKEFDNKQASGSLKTAEDMAEMRSGDKAGEEQALLTGEVIKTVNDVEVDTREGAYVNKDADNDQVDNDLKTTTDEEHDYALGDSESETNDAESEADHERDE